MVSISIMAHKSREEFIPYLEEKLGECKVFIDDGSLGVKKNSIRCWESYDKSEEYHLVIQDDAIITEDFHKKLNKYISKKPEILSLFLSKRTYPQTTKKGIFRVRKALTGGVGIVMKTKHIKGLIKYMNSQTMENDDTLISHYFRKKGIIIKYTDPSLLDHRHGIKSIVEKNIVPEVRTAKIFK